MSTTPFVKFKQDLGDNKFALNTVGYGMTESGIWVPIKVTDEGVQEVRQSGTVDEVIKELSGIYQTPSGWRAYGENISSGSNEVKPLDVSGYTDIVVRVRNNTQVEIGTEANVLRFYTTASIDVDITSVELSDVLFRVKQVPPIPAGAIAYYTSREYPELGEFCIGLVYSFWMATTPTDGTVEVSFFGRRR